MQGMHCVYTRNVGVHIVNEMVVRESYVSSKLSPKGLGPLIFRVRLVRVCKSCAHFFKLVIGRVMVRLFVF